MFSNQIQLFNLVLPARRRFQWRVVILLVLLYFLGNLAGIPLLKKTGMTIEPAWFWGVATLVSAAIIALSQALASRTALGAPLLEGLLPRSQLLSWARSGLGSILLILALSFPLSLYANRFADPSTYPFGWELLSASLKAGLVEEIGYRFFIVSLLVWLGRPLSHDVEGRPRPVVIWCSIILAGLLFGWAHVDARLAHPAVSTWDNAVILVLNSALGVTFGWLFWRLGLEWAILAHFAYDGFVSCILLPVYLSHNPLLWTGLSISLVLALFTSWRLLTRPRR